jgi:hypothetical protein
MPAKFSVPVDPDKLATQSVATALQPRTAKGKARRSGRSVAQREFHRKAGIPRTQTAAQPRRYAFRRS